MTIDIPYNFKARDYQVPFLREIERAMNGKSEKRYFMQIWPRRHGKDKCDIADIVPKRLIKSPCLVKYVYPTLVMGRDNLWDAMGGDGFKYLNHIPEAIRVGEPNRTRMTVETRSQGGLSLFQVAGADNPDSLRGGNGMLYVFSEWAEHDPYAWDVVEPIVRENDGIVIFNTTPKGDNHAKAMYEFARNHPKWHVELMTAKDAGVFTQQQLDEILQDTIARFVADGRSEEEAVAYYEQEYMCSFNSPVIGAYFGAAMRKAEQEGRITFVPHDKAVLVDTFWDIGVNDPTAIWFVQIVGNEIHLIDYYEKSNANLGDHLTALSQKPYVYNMHYLPHDAEAREKSSNKSYVQSAREFAKQLELDYRFAVVSVATIETGIEEAQRLFKDMWFDSKNCMRGIQVLKNYRSDFDKKHRTFRAVEVHDWASHGASALRTFALHFQKFRVQDLKNVTSREVPQDYLDKLFSSG